MEISPWLLARMLFSSFVFGLACGALYDVFRVLRILCGVRYSKKDHCRLYSLKLPFLKRPVRLFKSDKKAKALQAVVIFIGDFATVVFAGIGIVLLNYSYNNGSFRFLTVLGAFLGFLFYQFSFGKLFLKIAEPITFMIKYIFLSFLVILYYPLTKFALFVGKNIKKIFFCVVLPLKMKKKDSII